MSRKEMMPAGEARGTYSSLRVSSCVRQMALIDDASASLLYAAAEIFAFRRSSDWKRSAMGFFCDC